MAAFAGMLVTQPAQVHELATSGPEFTLSQLIETPGSGESEGALVGGVSVAGTRPVSGFSDGGSRPRGASN